MRLLKPHCLKCGDGRIVNRKWINKKDETGEYILSYENCDRCNYKEEGERYNLIHRVPIGEVTLSKI